MNILCSIGRCGKLLLNGEEVPLTKDHIARFDANCAALGEQVGCVVSSSRFVSVFRLS